MPRLSNNQKKSNSSYDKVLKHPIPPPLRQKPLVNQSSKDMNNTIQPPSMIDTMKQGFSFGIGSSIAHNMVNTIFNSKNKDEIIIKKEIINETKLTSENIYELYNKCLEKNDSNIDCSNILNNIIN
jgi:hypothetical protein